MINRRRFLNQLGLALLGMACNRTGTAAPPHILLRSSWQTINIGDIAHTPGVLRLLNDYLPEAEIYLWPNRLDNGVDELLLTHFPDLRIAQEPEALAEAFAKCDFLLHGSGASLVAERDVVRWKEETGKPYGIYGITLPPKKSHKTEPTPEAELARTIEVLSGAQFVFFRDSRSLDFARQKGCTAPLMAFGPDGAFACDLSDDERAEAFLKANALEPGNFLCCIPRLRYTPSWVIPSKNQPVDPVKHARNEEMKEQDHAPLRQSIIEVVRQTDRKILLCPEDQTQMQVGKELLLDQLPADVLEQVVWRPNYWLTGEAISTYVRSAGLFGNELHSAIMCIGHGVPAIICRWEEQTTKGYMWADIGLADWLFDLDDPLQASAVPAAVLELAKNPEAARAKAEKARQFVRKRQRETMLELANALDKG